MRLLVDTQILLWSLTQSPRLPREAERLLESGAHQVFFSAVSTWEVAIKASLKRPDFSVQPAELLVEAIRSGMIELPVHSSAAVRVASLPRHHKDPFDRLLVAQAIDERASLLTTDAVLSLYGSSVLHLGERLN